MASGSVGRKPYRHILFCAAKMQEADSKISQRKVRIHTTRCMLYQGVQSLSIRQITIRSTRRERSHVSSEPLLRATMVRNWEMGPRKRKKTMPMLRKLRCLQMYFQIDYEEYIPYTMQGLTMLRKPEHISEKATKATEVLLAKF